MSARPWMPFYFSDYLADTSHLSTTEHGAYFLLIAHYWAHGGLPADEAVIARITRMTARQWSRSRDILRSLFGDNWRHKRVDIELKQAIEKSRINSANAKRRHSGRTADAQRSDTQLQLQPQSEKKEERVRGVDVVSREAKPRAKRARARSLIAEDWKPSEQDTAYSISRGFTEQQISDMAAEFAPHHRAKGNEMADWHAAWCKWCNNEIKWNRGNSNGHRGSRPLQDDSRSVSRALDRLGEGLRQGTVQFAPRPRLVRDESESDLRLLPKG